MNRTRVYAAGSGLAVPEQPEAPAREVCGPHRAAVVRDLRGGAGRGPHGLRFGARDLVVVTGLPGSGKSTLMRRAVTGARVDSQDTRDRWDRRMAPLLPYAVYRPLVRLAHYAGLRRTLRAGRRRRRARLRHAGVGAPLARPRGGPPRRRPAPAAARRRGRTPRWTASAGAAGASRATPSPATAARSTGCCAPWSGAIRPRDAARRSSWTGGGGRAAQHRFRPLTGTGTHPH